MLLGIFTRLTWEIHIKYIFKEKKTISLPHFQFRFKTAGFFFNFFCVIPASVLYSAGNLDSNDNSVITTCFYHTNIQEIVSM